MKYFLSIMSIILGLGNFNAIANGDHTGTVTEVYIRTDGVQYFKVSGTPTGKPACATYDNWMIKDETSDMGKAQFSQALTVYATGKTVRVYGLGTCTRLNGFEDVFWIGNK